MNDDFEPNEEVRTIAADLLARIALDANSAPFDDDDPETWVEADEALAEVVRLGPVRFKIIDADATDLALAAGAIEAGDPPVLCMQVAFDQIDGAPKPCIGQYIVLPTDEPNVSLTFVVWITHADLHDPATPDLGPDAVRNEALDALQPGEVLLVQVINDPEVTE